jgi:MFS family permease
MRQTKFFGGNVVAATFLMAMLGWGIGFYGPPIFMYAVIERTGWSLALCSWAVTLHFLAGTLVVVNLPVLYRRFGLPLITVTGALILSIGVYGWSIAAQPYQLFIAATLSGLGWVTMGAAAVNAVIAPWFISKRPAALALAYNGASIGGVIFSSAWVYLIDLIGFTQATIGVGVFSTVIIAALSIKVFRVRPEHVGQHPDGASQAPVTSMLASDNISVVLRGNRRFITLATAMSLGLFAQIGLVSQLFLLLVAHVTATTAALAMGVATTSAIVGRFLSGRLITGGADRRYIACMSYGSQLLGCISLACLSIHPALLWVGVSLFGLGIGNATSLPPLIAQTEFPRHQLMRVVTLIVAIAQGCYAFAPAFFGSVKALVGGAQGELLMLMLAVGIQALAIVALSLGRSRSTRPLHNAQGL